MCNIAQWSRCRDPSMIVSLVWLLAISGLPNLMYWAGRLSFFRIMRMFVDSNLGLNTC
ncbi:hypothetical protein M3J09_004264 [Ascochyta lentis]